MRTHTPPPVLDLEHMTVETRGPLPAFNRELKIAQSIADVRLYLAPEELRILVGKVGRTGIAEPLVASNLLKFVEQRVELARVKRIAELPNQIGCPEEPCLGIRLSEILIIRNGEGGQIDGSANAVCVKEWMVREPLPHRYLRPLHVPRG